MSNTPKGYVNNRVFKLNVGFLLTSGPGHSHDSVIEFPMVRVADDLIVQHVTGPLRLSRTKEGILVQAQLQTALEDECYRCLDPIINHVAVDLEELYAYHSSHNAEFRINEDAILDLAPLLRAEVLIATSARRLCRPDCRGLCPQCGVNLNHTTCQCDLDDVDPRLAALRNLLDTS
jgi:uncharacterized protein